MKLDPEVGVVYDFELKPTYLRGWKVVGATSRCLKLDKVRYGKNGKPLPYNQTPIYLPVRNIQRMVRVKKAAQR